VLIATTKVVVIIITLYIVVTESTSNFIDVAFEFRVKQLSDVSECSFNSVG